MKKKPYEDFIVEEELSEDEARNAREDRKMLRQELFRMFQENPDKLSDIVEEELSEDEARNAREDRKMLRQELFRMFQENPDKL
jgi:DNA gyrase/topoisomerase IV subunit B